MKQETIFTKKPEVNTLRELAQEVNSQPLPNIPETPHVLLPPAEHSLMRNNYQVYSEEIHQNQNKEEPNKDDDLASTSKRNFMIGLKRKNHEYRPNVALSKKKMKLSVSNQDELSNAKMEPPQEIAQVKSLNKIDMMEIDRDVNNNTNGHKQEEEYLINNDNYSEEYPSNMIDFSWLGDK